MTFRISFLLVLMISLVHGCTSSSAPLVLNPYDGLDWANIERHKANLHTHTTESDGALSPAEVVALYAEAGYTILSLTDHDTDAPESPTWPWDAYGIDVQASGMLPILGNEISRPDHIGSYFNDYGDREQRSVPDALKEIGDRAGLAVMFHPGRYARRRTPDWYADLYRSCPHLIGMEVFNQNDRYPGDRAVYDAVLTKLMPDRPVWAMANDDFHRMEHFARSFNVFFLPPHGLNEVEFRRAFEAGHFVAVHNPSRDTEQVILPDRVAVSRSAIELAVSCDDDQVVWISDGHEIHRGKRLPLSTNLGGYVRVVLMGESGTETHLQPFGVRTASEPVRTELQVGSGDGSGRYLTGSRGVSIQADDPPEGSVFDRWTGDVQNVDDISSASARVDILQPGRIEIQAAYRPAETYTLTIEHGTANDRAPEATFQTIRADVPDGAVFDRWLGDIDGLDSVHSPSTRLLMPRRDVRLVATFVEDAVFAPQLQNGSFEAGIEGWQAKEEDVRLGYDEDGGRYLAVQPFSGIMQRIEGMDLRPGQRLTLHFEARIQADGNPLGFVGMQFLSSSEEELVHQSITIREHDWLSLAVSGVVIEEVVTPNIFVWMRRGELQLRNFRLRIGDE